jgi:hypothetical protein
MFSDHEWERMQRRELTSCQYCHEKTEDLAIQRHLPPPRSSPNFVDGEISPGSFFRLIRRPKFLCPGCRKGEKELHDVCVDLSWKKH